MGSWYCTLEAVKRAVDIAAADKNRVISEAIEAASREIDNLTERRFIPKTETLYFDWPQRDARNPYTLYLDDDVLSVSALTRDGDDAVAIVAADYFLEPSWGPPYNSIQIDLASSAYFANKNTHQRAIRVTVSRGYSNATKTAGALAEALDSSETGVDVTDASLADVGDTLLCESEQMFVTDRAVLDTTANLNDTLTADMSDVTVTVTDGTKVKVNEVILIESERMLVTDVTGNNLTVKRAWDGTVLAAHSGALDVYAYRTLTVERGANGTTAAAHDTATSLSRYAPPADIVKLCKALAINDIKTTEGGWTGTFGSGEGLIEVKGTALARLKRDIQADYRRYLVGAV